MTNSNLLKLVLTIFKWFLVFFFTLATIGAISEKGYISAIIFLLITLLLLPPLTEFLRSKISFLTNKLIKGGLLFVLFVVGMGMFPNLEKYKKPKEQVKIEPEKEIKKTVETGNNYDANGNKAIFEKPLFKEFVSYEEAPYTKDDYKDLRTHYYGVYINLPKDTIGIANKIKEYLNNKDLKDREATHIYFFTDSTVIPERFDEQHWSNKAMRKNLAHIVKLTNGNIIYSVDEFGEFKR